MLSYRLRRVIIAAPTYLQRSFSISRHSDLIPVSSLLPRSVVKHSTEFNRSPARLFSTTQYQYDPYTGEDSFTPDNEGCDFNHWLITMDFSKENRPSREEMISIFEQTCAKGLGLSLEDAKKKIYAICTTSYQGFQAIMSVGEVEKFRELPGVQYIIPDSYVDVENKVYGGDKYENGMITPGPVPVPTREGFDSVEKEPKQELVQIVETLPDQSPTSGQVRDQGNQTPLDRRSFNQSQETLALGQGQSRGQGSQVPSFERSFKQSQGTPSVGLGQGQGSQMPLYQRSFKQGQGIPINGERKAQGSEMPSFQGRLKQSQESPIVRQGQAQGSQMTSFQGGNNQSQRTPIHGQGHGQGQGQGSQIPSFQGVNNQSQGTPIHGQGHGQGQGSQIPSYQVGYSQGQGLPSNHGQGALGNYNQGPPLQGNFNQGTHENYNQMGQGNYTPQSGGNYGPAHGAGSPGFGHGQGQGGQIPSYQMSYSQGLGAPVPPYQGNYIQGTPNNYGQWAFVNYNQGPPPHGNFFQGPPQNYNQGGQWNYSPLNGGHYGPAQWYPGTPQGQGNQMPQYQFSYNQCQGALIPGQWRCQGCGMLSYQGSYNQGLGTQIPGQWQGQGCAMPSYQAGYNEGQRAPAPPYHGMPSSYGQGTSVNHNNQGSNNIQSGGNYGPAYGSAGNPGFEHGQNQAYQQEDQRNVAGDLRNSNSADPREARKPNPRT